ncbi:uncharacterized protein [Coffea arabica]|uniref:ATP-dependent DNA helicase n=1 Tax=Coffea arabica TaxID=13443 RepID=A0A6P6XKP3_COFAR|nr:uncharacterized protein LOC113743874 [Coffea arabica]
MVTVSPADGERYYLRLLLNHVHGPTSFDDILTVADQKLNSFRGAALALGLLQSDTYIDDSLQEAVAFQMPSSLRLLFATLLVHCSPVNPQLLWEKFHHDLSTDYQHQCSFSVLTPSEITTRALQDINRSLEQMGKRITDYQLTSNDFHSPFHERLTQEIESKRGLHVAPEDLLLPLKLNSEQKNAYDLILAACFSAQGEAFFIDGPEGTGKTFLYRSLLATLRSLGYIAIAVATSGIAASILPGGRTAHSRFKIPLDFSKNKACQLSKQSSVAKLLLECKLILWDEASMAKRERLRHLMICLKI